MKRKIVERDRIGRAGFARWDLVVRQEHRRWIERRAVNSGRSTVDEMDDVLKFAREILSENPTNNAKRSTPVGRSAKRNPGKQTTPKK